MTTKTCKWGCGGTCAGIEGEHKFVCFDCIPEAYKGRLGAVQDLALQVYGYTDSKKSEKKCWQWAVATALRLDAELRRIAP